MTFYQNLLEENSYVSITDIDGTILYVNDRFCEVTKYSREELIGQNHRILKSDKHSPEFYTDLWAIISSGKTWHGEMCNRAKDGALFWVDTFISPEKDSNGKILKYYSFRIPITKRKEAEDNLVKTREALLTSERHYRFLYDNTPIMNFILEPTGIVRSINKFGASQLGYTTNELIGQPVFKVFPRATQEEAANHVANCIANPLEVFEWEIQKIKKDGTIIWVKEVAWAEADPNENMLVTIACEDITEAKLSTEALKAENKILTNSPSVAFKWKAEDGWPVEFVSSNVSSVFGYTAQEFIQRPILFSSVIHPDDLDRIILEMTVNSVTGKDIFEREYRILTPNGDCRWIHDHTLILRNDLGEITHYQGHIFDITDQKRAREEVVLMNSRLTALIESIPDAIFFKDGAGRWLITNEAAKKLFKLHDIDWQGKSEMELAELRPEFRRAHEICQIDDEKAWAEKKLTLFTEFVVDELGRTREYEVRKMPVFKADGSRKALVIIGTDITERRQAETELTRTKKGLEQTMRLAKIGGWEADYKNETITWSGITRELADVPDDYVPQLSTVLNFYKEGESREKMKAAMLKAVKEGVGFEMDLQMVSATGKEYWAKTIAEPKMVNGKCERVIGYFQNITEQVELSRKNREIERKFSRLIEKSTDAIVLQDGGGSVIYFSPAAERILGYTQEEAMSKDPLTVYHPDDLPKVIARRKEIINSPGKSFDIATSRMLHKAGHYVYVEGTVTNLLNDENVRAMVSNFRDVTEKRLTEENLKMKNARLEEIAWLFSHEVRGPVATIIGLSGLFNHADKTDPLNEEILAKLLIPVHRLDEIISKIVRQTNQLEDETLTKVISNGTH